MPLYCAGKKIKFIYNNNRYNPNILSVVDYEKSILGIGKLGFIKVEGYFIKPRTMAMLGVGEVGYMVIGRSSDV